MCYISQVKFSKQSHFNLSTLPKSGKFSETDFGLTFIKFLPSLTQIIITVLFLMEQNFFAHILKTLNRIKITPLTQAYQ